MVIAWIQIGCTRVAAENLPARSTAQQSSPAPAADPATFDHWGKFASPHFLIYTDAGRDEATTLLRRMETLHVAAQRFFGRSALRIAPTTFVLPTTRSDWRKIESAGKAEWFASMTHPARVQRNLIVAHYDWQGKGPQLIWAQQGRAEIDWLGLGDPFWFRRGVGAFFETAHFVKEGVELGRANGRSYSLSFDGWLPWQRLFEVTKESPEYAETDGYHQYSGQCALFVQFLLTQPGTEWSERLMTWSSLLLAGRAPTEAEFKGVFGQDWKTWQRTMEEYYRNGSHQITTLRPTAEAVDFVPQTPALAMGEMRELFLLCQILNQRAPASEAALDALLARGLKTDALRDILIEACLEWKRPAAALAEARKLIAAGTTNPAVYATAARQVIRACAAVPDLQVRLGDDVREIREWCQKALEQEPRHAVAANQLAWAEALAADVSRENIARLEKLYLTLNGSSSTSQIVAAMAVGRWRMGEADAARLLVQKLLASPFTDPLSRGIAAALDKELAVTSPK